MAAPDAANLYVASPAQGTGGVFTAPVGTVLPSTVSAALTGFTDCGLIGEDGVTSIKEISTVAKKAWGGRTVRTLQTEYARKFTLVFSERNAAVLGLINGDGNVTVSGTAISVDDDGTETPHFAMVIDTIDGDKALRYLVSKARVIEQDDVTLVHSDTTGFGVTIECYPDANGRFVLELSDDVTSS